jgi:transposase-like protein
VSEPLRLSTKTIEALADRVAEQVVERLREDGAAVSMVSVAEVARRFGISRDYIYDHAAELGAVRLGDGPRARLRLDPAKVAARLSKSASPSPPEKRETKRTQRRRPRSARRVPVLPVGEGGDPQPRRQRTGEISAKNHPHAETAGLSGGDHG